MNTFLLLNTLEVENTRKDNVHASYILSQQSQQHEHSKTREIRLLYSGIRLPEIQHRHSARPWVVILSQLFYTPDIFLSLYERLQDAADYNSKVI